MNTENTDPSAPNAPECKTLMVVEDDSVIRDTMVQIILESGFAEHVLAFGRASEAIAHAQHNEVEVAVVDLGLPDMTGVELIENLRRVGCRADILVVTTSQQTQKIVASIQAGASGYFLKTTLRQDLVPYLRTLKKGGAALDPHIARRLLDVLRPAPVATPSQQPPGIPRPLSEQEIRILTYVAKGFTSKEIAELLGLSPLTVSTHIRNIYRKLSVKNRTEAVFEASNQGIIAPVSPAGPVLPKNMRD